MASGLQRSGKASAITVNSDNEPNGQITRDYDSAYVDDLLEFCKFGGDPSLFAAHRNIPPKSIDLWRSQYPDFGDAYQIGLLKCIDYWCSSMEAAATRESRLKFESAKFRLSQIYLRNNLKDKSPIYSPNNKKASLTTDFDLAEELNDALKNQK